MKAIIFSRDEGTRLRPITCTTPKALLPLMGKTVIEYMIAGLIRHGIYSITITTNYLSEEVKNHISSLDFKDAFIRFDTEKNLGSYFDSDDTLLIDDGVVTDLDIGKVIKVFSEKRCVVIPSGHGTEAYEYGSILCDGEGKIKSFIRCPDFARPVGAAAVGIALVPKGTVLPDVVDISSLLQRIADKSIPALSLRTDDYIASITDFESYKKCIRDFMDKKIALPVSCSEKAPGVWIHENATVMQGSVIVPPVYIDADTVISKGARVEAYSQIGKNVDIGCFAGIKRSVIFDGCHIGENSSLRGSVAGKSTNIGFESAVYENSVLGDNVSVGNHCIVKTGIHIWPDKFIDDETIVSENIIWGNSSSSKMFDNSCAEGILNYDITPEFAVSLARGVVKLLGKKIAVSCDGGGNGTMIKNALLSGIQSAGGKGYDMGEQPLPITRSGISFYHLDGGISLSTHSENGNLYGSLDIINSYGSGIEDEDLRKLRFLTQSCQGDRTCAKNIVEPEFLFEYKLYYLKQLINSTSERKLGAKLLIHCPSLWGCELLKSAADDLRCDFTFTESSSKEEFRKAIKKGEYDFGAICDYKCETLTLVKPDGEFLSEFDYCALTSLIIMKSFSSPEIFVPQFAPESIDSLAKKYTATVYRTGVSLPHLMNELSKSTHKIYLHQFIYHFDAVGAIILLMDFLKKEKTTINALMGEIPASYIVSTDIPLNGKDQEKIVRRFSEKHLPSAPGPHDGIKVDFEKGWVLIIPKKTKSAINVISHGQSKEYAREIADIITDDLAGR